MCTRLNNPVSGKVTGSIIYKCGGFRFMHEKGASSIIYKCGGFR